MFARLIGFILLLLCSSILAFEDDGCPPHFRRCNDECLEKTTNHTTPCEEGPWGKCLSATFPFYCPLTNTCIQKDELCGDLCFNGNPGSFWYDHWRNVDSYDNWYERWSKADWVEKDNKWRLEEGSYDAMQHQIHVLDKGPFRYSEKVPVWLERYNCNGKCVSYLESCNGGCDHPDGIDKGGVTINLKNPVHYIKCGKECREKNEMSGFHDCGEACLPQNIPCHGTCPDSTNWATGPQLKCGNECRPGDHFMGSISYQGIISWRACPDGTCRDKSVYCGGPLPGACPADQVLCRYSGWIRGTDFDCKDSSKYYVCKEDRASNALGNLFGKHDDEWCNGYDEVCEGECQPGYVKCMIDNPPTCKNCIPTCKNATEYIQCGDECKKTKDYYSCNGACLSTEKACNGNCTVGFEKCGDRCVASADVVNCNGKCQLVNELCDGKCLKNGLFKAGDVCRPDTEKGNFYKCNGVFLDLEIPCDGKCDAPRPSPYRTLCDGKCLESWDTQYCSGQCKHRKEVCDGGCYYNNNVPCGNQCIKKDEPCKGECHDVNHPFKCIHPRFGETCLDTKLIGDGKEDCIDGSDEKTYCFQGQMCDGKLICGNEPCHSICPSHVNKTLSRFRRTEKKTYPLHYCAEEDKCKLEDEPCNGVCVVDLVGKGDYGSNVEPKDQFACHDGSKCLDTRRKVCNGYKECNDGSDEVCKVRGCKNCNLEVVKEGSVLITYFHCESGDQKIRTEIFCDGTKDCRDGSDEKECDTCPGIVQCNQYSSVSNDEFVCANLPCKDRKNDTNLFCSNSESPFLWDLCHEGPTQKCVKRSWKGGSFEVYKGKMIEGDLCNGECLQGGHKCGDKCLPPGLGTTWACDGSCNNQKGRGRPVDGLVHCDGRCFTQDELQSMRRSGDVLTCNGECRYFGNWPQENRYWAIRKSCNGVCLSRDDGKDPFLPCATGNECFPAKKWCDGINNCQDGSDEAKCSECSELVRCEHKSHPLQNQTESKGPGFPDYVCSDEPCGTCADPDTFPCGNRCIPNDNICPLTGRNGIGMWFCNGKMQLKTIPCL